VENVDGLYQGSLRNVRGNNAEKATLKGKIKYKDSINSGT